MSEQKNYLEQVTKKYLEQKVHLVFQQLNYNQSKNNGVVINNK